MQERLCTSMMFSNATFVILKKTKNIISNLKETHYKLDGCNTF